MRKLLVPLVAVGLITIHALRADAVPACLPTAESFLLNTSEDATFNGEPLRALGNGRYAVDRDGGVEVFLNQGSPILTAVLEPGAACLSPAQRVTLNFVDPWTGEPRTLTVGEAP